MGISFKVSKAGTRYHRKPIPLHDNNGEEEGDFVSESKDNSQFRGNATQSVAATGRERAAKTRGEKQYAKGSHDKHVSFVLCLYLDGYTIEKASEGEAAYIAEVPKNLHPYDRASESLFSAIESGRLPGNILDDIPCKYINGKIICEVRDYRKCFTEGVNASLLKPITNKVRLRMTLESVVKDMPLISDNAWTYGDLLEVESRILKALQPKLCLDPKPKLDKLSYNPTCNKVNLEISSMRKRSCHIAEVTTTPSSNIRGKKVCIGRVPESSMLVDSGNMLHPSSIENLQSRNNGQTNMLGQRTNNFGSPSLLPGNSSGLLLNSQVSLGQETPVNYSETLNSSNFLLQKKRQRIVGYGNQQNQSEGFYGSTSLQQPLLARGLQYGNSGGLNQETGSINLTQGMRYALKEEPIDTKRIDKMEIAQSKKNNMNMKARIRSLSVDNNNIDYSTIIERFSKIDTVTTRYELNREKGKAVRKALIKSKVFPSQDLLNHLSTDSRIESYKDNPCSMPLSNSLIGGSMNVRKARVLNFMQPEGVIQGNSFSVVPKLQTRLIMSEKSNDGSVAMHIGEIKDYFAAEDYLLTLPNTHTADLFAAQFCSLMNQEGYQIEDHVQPRPVPILHELSNQLNTPGNNAAMVESSLRQDPMSSLLRQQSMTQHSRCQQSSTMFSANPSSHLNSSIAGQNPGGVGGHNSNRLQMLPRQQQQLQRMQHRKMMMGHGTVGKGNNGNNMDGLGNYNNNYNNIMGMAGVRGMCVSGQSTRDMGNMAQNSINLGQAGNMAQQFRSGTLTPTQAAYMVGNPQSVGSSGLSMLNPSLNRANIRPMQRAVGKKMVPPKSIAGMNAYMNQQQQLQLHLQQQQLQLQQHNNESNSSLQSLTTTRFNEPAT